MTKPKCCYCGKKVDMKDGVIIHPGTKKNLCIKCVSDSLSAFLTGIAPHIHAHAKKEEQE